MNLCAKCGQQLKPDARFCGACGENIITTQQITIPEAFRNPAAGQGATSFLTSGQEFSMNNSQRRIVNLWLILMALFVFCMFVPSIIGLDGFDGGFAMSFTAGFMVIISLVVIFIYRSRAKQLDKILKGEGRIAVWRYSQEEWVRFIAADFEDEKKIKKSLFIVVSVIAIIVGTITMFVYENILLLVFSAAIIPIVAIPAFWVPRARFNKLKNSEPKALIAEKGVIVGKMFHLWVNLGASLDEVKINSEDNSDIIEFTYSMPTRTGRQVEVARVPVPKEKPEEAIKIIDYFNSREK
jgi:membrane protein YdbS with pleckstrin-like domain